eukprot:TRINITY_DN78504_c0_g1_i1.p1 TRINITY_DN78504_c0_g1~~TRINITY_DN78504_c0_g1_i1.p1  ORF type:complete len:217 (-),score=43.81 TRINITY_DN78504_c0_g1_i1:77-727(-)
MDVTCKPVLTAEFQKALTALRTRPFSRLTQKQAEAIIAVLAHRESPNQASQFGWSFAEEMDDFTKILPFAVSAFSAIDRDCDEIVSREEFEAWLQAPQIEHRTEISQFGADNLPSVEESLPSHCKRGLDGPNGLAKTMRRIRVLHFDIDGRSSLSLRDFVLATMKVVVDARKGGDELDTFVQEKGGAAATGGSGASAEAESRREEISGIANQPRGP